NCVCWDPAASFMGGVNCLRSKSLVAPGLAHCYRKLPMPVPKIIPLRLFQDNFAYLLNVPGSAKAVVVDAGEAGPVLRLLQEQQWQLELILCTHHHPDHVGGH